MLNVYGVEMNSVVDGPGVRMSVFLQGCPHKCEGCHNPETWDYSIEREIVRAEVLLEIFKGNSLLSGITISGGEPLSPNNIEGLITLTKGVKETGKTVWLYTGYTIEEIETRFPDVYDSLLNYVDVLVDGRFKKELLNNNIRFRGSSNQRLIDVEKYKKGVPFTLK